MANHHKFDKAAAAKKIYSKPRELKVIEQEYANTASSLGDAYFSSELQKAKVQQLTLRLSELKDEHDQAKATVKPEEQVDLVPVAEIIDAPVAQDAVVEAL